MNGIALLHKLLVPWRTAITGKRSADAILLWVVAESILLDTARFARAMAGLSSRGLSSLTSLTTLLTPVVFPYFVSVILGAALLWFASRQKIYFATALAAAPLAYVPHVFASIAFVLLEIRATPFVRQSVSFGLCVPWLFIGMQVARQAAIVSPGTAKSDVIRFTQGPLRALGLPVLAVLHLGLGLALFSQARIVSARWQDLRPVGRGDQLRSASLTPVSPYATPQTLTFPRSRKVVFDFWATWCPPCRAALPEWQQMNTELGGIADFVSVNQESEQVPMVRDFLLAHGYSFAAHHDDTLSQRLQVEVLPTMIVVGEDGTIEQYWVGGGSLPQVRAALAKGSEK